MLFSIKCLCRLIYSVLKITPISTRDIPDFSFLNPTGAGFGWIYEDKSGRSQGRSWSSEFSST